MLLTSLRRNPNPHLTGGRASNSPTYKTMTSRLLQNSPRTFNDISFNAGSFVPNLEAIARFFALEFNFTHHFASGSLVFIYTLFMGPLFDWSI